MGLRMSCFSISPSRRGGGDGVQTLRASSSSTTPPPPPPMGKSSSTMPPLAHPPPPLLGESSSTTPPLAPPSWESSSTIHLADPLPPSMGKSSSSAPPLPPSGESSSTTPPLAPPSWESSSTTPPPSGESSSSIPPPFAASSSSALPSLSEQQYEVFLSFRGDTRREFTDHLYKGLINANVSVFRDKEELPLGERNWPEIVKAIGTSRISILVISSEYASSEWCLDELIQILECKKTFGQLVIPIFYRVKPSDLRKESYVDPRLRKIRRHDFDGAHVQEWKGALIKVSYMTGLESEKIADRYEGELVEMVVTRVLKALKALRKPTLNVSDDLVGVNDHVEEIMKRVNDEGSIDVHAFLIHGMGGIGKTTLAKVIYNQLTYCFDCYSFLADIRETWRSQHKGKVELQEQLILDILGKKESISSVDRGVEVIRERFKSKKVLILLDDVDHRDQLNALAGKSDWFGRGSMLIVTSRVNDVLKKWEGSFSYELNGLNDDQSFQLFCRHAFNKSHSIPNEFHTIAKDIVSTTGGLPLAIEVIGCLLYGENLRIWKEKLKKLKEIPNDEVQSKLKISFDALKHEEQQIFLDIACLRIHRGSDSECALHMWESCGFYPELGIRKLVLMSLIKIGESKELIIHDQLRDLGREVVRQESRNNLGQRSRLWKIEEALEVLELKQGTEKVETLCLSNFIRNREHYTSKQFEGMTELRYLYMGAVNLETGDFKNLCHNLRWLCWVWGGLDFMESNFIPKKLVVLQLEEVNITVEWMGWSQMKRLKVISLSFCDCLTAIPDLSALEELEVLELAACKALTEIHQSIGKFSKSLKVLEISECDELELPKEVGKMEELRELSVTHSKKIRCLPDSIGSLVKLRRLVLSGCKLLTEIPKSIGNLKLLTEIDLTWTGVTQLPDSIGDLCNLESLFLSDTRIRCLPTSVRKLSKLKVLHLWFCHELESLPCLPCSLTSLQFHGHLMETLPDFSDLIHLENLQFTDDVRWNRALDFGNRSRMQQTLQIGCDVMVQFGFLDPTRNHWELFYDVPFRCSRFGAQIESEVSKDINLLVEPLSNLVKLRLKKNDTLQTLPNFSNWKNLSLLSIERCPKLMKIDGLDGAEKLKDLTIVDCRNLVEINGLNKAESIQKVFICACPSLEKLGDLSHLKTFATLVLCQCNKLSEIQGFEILWPSEVLHRYRGGLPKPLTEWLDEENVSFKMWTDEENESFWKWVDEEHERFRKWVNEESECHFHLLEEDGSERDSNPLKDKESESGSDMPKDEESD